MIQVAILKRRLKPGKTYEDFRRAWYHTVGFGTSTKMLTVLNALDPREIIVIGLTEASLEQVPGLIAIDTKERGEHSLDDVIEPGIDRAFGVLVAEDNFSPAGAIAYQPPMVDGQLTDMVEIQRDLQEGIKLIAKLRPDIQLTPKGK